MTPICVDLDHTLIKTDALHEQFIQFVKEKPFQIFLLIIWLLKGRSYLKHRLEESVSLDVDSLPYNQDVINFLKEKSQVGHPIYLVSATHENIIQMITRKFEFFSGGWGTSKELNLKGKKQGEFSRQRVR